MVIEATFETQSSLIAFGSHNHQPVALKVIKQQGDEWRSGEVLAQFDGQGSVRVYEQVAGAVLLERLTPGNSLVDMVLDGKDEEATTILGNVIERMFARESQLSGVEPSKAFVTVQDWARGFERYLATGDDQIPEELVMAAQGTYSDLCASQRELRLLHGDLHHY
ncbi:MAG: streptomycin 6-kinase, partial [Acidobacteriota bacterium]|nr:streptomycin 6-kinase [Acidobacteriota bacterium]